MTRRLHWPACCAAALLLCSAGAQAYDKAKPPVQPQGQAGSQPLPAKAAKAVAPVKLVDINSAGRTELKTLPGIGDAEADKIIAARPYPSKAKLLADKVLPDDKYQALLGRIVATQKDRTAAKARASTAPRPVTQP